ncbi:hypothetical protein TNCV_4423981 [Trichonephila clavipes]|nr:hypothetical protein TNCV_4423981 [Trichonephila clavipes]
MYLFLFGTESRAIISTRPNPMEAQDVDDVSIANPFLSREELIIKIYSLLQLVCGEKFIYTAGIVAIAFFSFSGSERVKRHRASTEGTQVSSTHLLQSAWLH